MNDQVDRAKIEKLLSSISSGGLAFKKDTNRIIKALRDAVRGPDSSSGEDFGGRGFCIFKYVGRIHAQPGRYFGNILNWGADPEAEDELLNADAAYDSDKKDDDSDGESDGDSGDGSGSQNTGDDTEEDPDLNEPVEVWNVGDLEGKTWSSTAGTVSLGFCIGDREDGTTIILSIDPAVRVGKIVTSGPEDENDFVDSRYWVEIQDVRNDYGDVLSIEKIKSNYESFYPVGDDNNAGMEGDYDSDNTGKVITAINIAQSPSGGARVLEGTTVLLFACRNQKGELIHAFSYLSIPKPLRKYDVFTAIDDTLNPIWTTLRVQD